MRVPRPLITVLLIIILHYFYPATLTAKPVSSQKAHEAVNVWLAEEAKPMNCELGSEIKCIETFKDGNDRPLYHVVYLKPNGFVIVAGDDLIEPVICFSSDGVFDPSENNPLTALVSQDLTARVNVSHSAQARLLANNPDIELTKMEKGLQNSARKAMTKWARLSGMETASSSSKSKSGISDIRVAPLLASKWGQATDNCNKALYNYYTPVYGAGNARNYPAGCVATAMVQCMRYWQYPTAGVGTASFPVTINGYSNSRNLRGGDGAGGPYNWSQMPTAPGCSATDIQRQAIGTLLFDAGVSVSMAYGTDGSSAYLSDAAASMINTFYYSNAISAYNYDYDIGAGLTAMINPNLDAGSPVILGIYGDSGHAVVADGYGFQDSTPYHHLNMGWNGFFNIWYNLPDIESTYYSFNTVDAVIYNIYISGSGEIISGRVMAPGSKSPLSGAIVTAINGYSDETFQTTTNARGIYAFTNVSPYSSYAIRVTKPGYSFPDNQAANTGLSQDDHDISGNCWGVDLVSNACISKCTVTAGKTCNIGTIAVSGTLNALVENILGATEIDVSINSASMPSPAIWVFPVNSTTFINGKFKSTISNTTFTFDTASSKFSLSAKNADLTGLCCPLDMQVIVDGLNEVTEVNEVIVNAAKPIPINFLMNVTNSLRVDKAKFTRNGTTGNITSASLTGVFSMQNTADSNMSVNQFDITIGSQTYSIPSASFKYSKGKFSCSKITLSNGTVVTASFDFNKCSWTLTMKGMTLSDSAGETDFDMVCGAFDADSAVTLP